VVKFRGQEYAHLPPKHLIRLRPIARYYVFQSPIRIVSPSNGTYLSPLGPTHSLDTDPVNTVAFPYQASYYRRSIRPGTNRNSSTPSTLTLLYAILSTSLTW